MRDSSPAATTAWSLDVWQRPVDGARSGGDWCEAIAGSQDCTIVCIGDVCGHGVAATQAMERMRDTVRSAARGCEIPSRVLSAANSVAYASGSDGIMVTAVVAVLDRRLRTLTFANAGHPPPLMAAAAGLDFLQGAVGDLPLGILRGHRAADYVVALPEDALMVFYTDGVTERSRDVLRGERDLMDACRFAYDRSLPDAAHAIARALFPSGCRHDDAAILTIRM